MEHFYYFICVENAGRSVMAEYIGKKYGLNCASGGTEPSDKPNETVIAVMKEIGIDVSNHVPNMIDEKILKNATDVILMGCSIEEKCPAILYKEIKEKMTDWNLEDPKSKDINKVREIRDLIKERIEKLVQSS